MFQYKAGYKFVEGGVHAQVLDFPADRFRGGPVIRFSLLGFRAALVSLAGK